MLCVLLFVAWTAESPNDASIYCGYWLSPFVLFGPLWTSLPSLNLTPWQILLLVLAPFCLLRPGASRGHAWPMYVAILTSFVSVAITFLWGWLRGGSAYNAYFQLWHFLAGLLVGALLLSVVRTSRDLKALGLTILTAALVRGTLAIYFYWAHVHGQIEPPPPYMTTHDDSLLFVAGLLTFLSWALARKTWAVWLAAALVFAHLSYAIVLNNRRLAWIELVFAVPLVYLLLPDGGLRRRLNRWLLVTAPLVFAYAVVGFDRPEPVFAPLRALSTAGSDEDASSLARLEEIRNLLYTLSAAGNPLLGTGWGMEYQKVSSVYANFGPEWWQYLYLPHNSLLGVAVFAGLVGICGIWLVVPVAAFLAARAYRGSTRPADRAAALAALCILPAYGVQCYGDIGFQSFTGNLILGVAIAVAGRVSAGVAAPSRGTRQGGSWASGSVAPVRARGERTRPSARR